MDREQKEDELSSLNDILNIQDMNEDYIDPDYNTDIPHMLDDAPLDNEINKNTFISDVFEKKDSKPQDINFTKSITLRDKVITFMNETYPIFEAGIKNGVDPFFFAGDGQLPKALKMTLDLAKRIADIYTDEIKPTSSEINAFRYVASLLISEIMSSEEEDAEENFNADALVQDIAQAFRNSKKELLNSDLVKIIHEQDNISILSMKLSSMLISPVLTYEFRKNPNILIKEMTRKIIDKAIKYSYEISSLNDNEEIRYKILDTLVTILTKIMVQAYQKQAQKIISITTRKSEMEKRDIFQDYDPLKDVFVIFDDYTSLFKSTTLLYKQKLETAKKNN